MGGFGTLLATNPGVVALANLGGLVGLGLILWALGKRLTEFAMSVHKNRIRGAIKESKLKRRRFVRLLASDLHLFIITFIGRGLAILMSQVVLIVGMVGVDDKNNFQLIKYSPYIKSVITIVNELILPVVAMLMVFGMVISTLNLSQAIWRQRVRILRRKQIRLAAWQKRQSQGLAVEP